MSEPPPQRGCGSCCSCGCTRDPSNRCCIPRNRNNSPNLLDNLPPHQAAGDLMLLNFYIGGRNSLRCGVSQGSGPDPRSYGIQTIQSFGQPRTQNLGLTGNTEQGEEEENEEEGREAGGGRRSPGQAIPGGSGDVPQDAVLDQSSGGLMPEGHDGLSGLGDGLSNVTAPSLYSEPGSEGSGQGSTPGSPDSQGSQLSPQSQMNESDGGIGNTSAPSFNTTAESEGSPGSAVSGQASRTGSPDSPGSQPPTQSRLDETDGGIGNTSAPSFNTTAESEGSPGSVVSSQASRTDRSDPPGSQPPTQSLLDETDCGIGNTSAPSFNTTAESEGSPGSVVSSQASRTGRSDPPGSQPPTQSLLDETDGGIGNTSAPSFNMTSGSEGSPAGTASLSCGLSQGAGPDPRTNAIQSSPQLNVAQNLGLPGNSEQGNGSRSPGVSNFGGSGDVPQDALLDQNSDRLMPEGHDGLSGLGDGLSNVTAPSLYSEPGSAGSAPGSTPCSPDSKGSQLSPQSQMNESVGGIGNTSVPSFHTTAESERSPGSAVSGQASRTGRSDPPGSQPPAQSRLDETDGGIGNTSAPSFNTTSGSERSPAGTASQRCGLSQGASPDPRSYGIQSSPQLNIAQNPHVTGSSMQGTRSGSPGVSSFGTGGNVPQNASLDQSFGGPNASLGENFGIQTLPAQASPGGLSNVTAPSFYSGTGSEGSAGSGQASRPGSAVPPGFQQTPPIQPPPFQPPPFRLDESHGGISNTSAPSFMTSGSERSPASTASQRCGLSQGASPDPRSNGIQSSPQPIAQNLGVTGSSMQGSGSPGLSSFGGGGNVSQNAALNQSSGGQYGSPQLGENFGIRTLPPQASPGGLSNVTAPSFYSGTGSEGSAGSGQASRPGSSVPPGFQQTPPIQPPPIQPPPFRLDESNGGISNTSAPSFMTSGSERSPAGTASPRCDLSQGASPDLRSYGIQSSPQPIAQSFGVTGSSMQGNRNGSPGVSSFGGGGNVPQNAALNQSSGGPNGSSQLGENFGIRTLPAAASPGGLSNVTAPSFYSGTGSEGSAGFGQASRPGSAVPPGFQLSPQFRLNESYGGVGNITAPSFNTTSGSERSPAGTASQRCGLSQGASPDPRSYGIQSSPQPIAQSFGVTGSSEQGNRSGSPGVSNFGGGGNVPQNASLDQSPGGLNGSSQLGENFGIRGLPAQASPGGLSNLTAPSFYSGTSSEGSAGSGQASRPGSAVTPGFQQPPPIQTPPFQPPPIQTPPFQPPPLQPPPFRLDESYGGIGNMSAPSFNSSSGSPGSAGAPQGASPLMRAGAPGLAVVPREGEGTPPGSPAGVAVVLMFCLNS